MTDERLLTHLPGLYANAVFRELLLAELLGISKAHVARSSGANKFMLQSIWAVVNQAGPKFAARSSRRFLPKALRVLQPTFRRGLRAGDVAAEFQNSSNEIADQLVSVMDEFREETERVQLAKLYDSWRASLAAELVLAAPAIGEGLDRSVNAYFAIGRTARGTLDPT
ncbi:MAG: hypothetical protein V3V01_01695 [Acidimicrobiales bacterium]